MFGRESHLHSANIWVGSLMWLKRKSGLFLPSDNDHRVNRAQREFYVTSSGLICNIRFRETEILEKLVRGQPDPPYLNIQRQPRIHRNSSMLL